MTDVAVNGQGELWSISTTRIYRIELQGAQVHWAPSRESRPCAVGGFNVYAGRAIVGP